MPITPTSTKSKNYQALGIDEIARDIETAFKAINKLEGGGSSEYTETIVNISSAKILAMGSTPIELLPAAGVRKYYDIDKIIIELNIGTIPYTFESLDALRILGYGVIDAESISTAPFNMAFNPNGSEVSPSDLAVGQFSFINSPVTLTTVSGTDPADGDGTLRVKIYHKTVTFGA